MYSVYVWVCVCACTFCAPTLACNFTSGSQIGGELWGHLTRTEFIHAEFTSLTASVLLAGQSGGKWLWSTHSSSLPNAPPPPLLLLWRINTLWFCICSSLWCLYCPSRCIRTDCRTPSGCQMNNWTFIHKVLTIDFSGCVLDTWSGVSRLLRSGEKQLFCLARVWDTSWKL